MLAAPRFAGFEPSLDESCGRDEVLRAGGVVADQPLGEDSLINHPPPRIVELGEGGRSAPPRCAGTPPSASCRARRRAASRCPPRPARARARPPAVALAASRRRARPAPAPPRQQQHAVVGHLHVALGLSEADDVGLALVQAKLGRIEHRQHRLVVGEDADRADRGPRRDHLDLVVEHLAFRGQDLDRELLGPSSARSSGRARRLGPSPSRPEPSASLALGLLVVARRPRRRRSSPSGRTRARAGRRACPRGSP